MALRLDHGKSVFLTVKRQKMWIRSNQPQPGLIALVSQVAFSYRVPPSVLSY